MDAKGERVIRLLDLVSNRPGITNTEIAKANIGFNDVSDAAATTVSLFYARSLARKEVTGGGFGGSKFAYYPMRAVDKAAGIYSAPRNTRNHGRKAPHKKSGAAASTPSEDYTRLSIVAPGVTKDIVELLVWATENAQQVLLLLLLAKVISYKQISLVRDSLAGIETKAA